MVGVSGSIAAVRRELFRPIPAGTLLDDVYWPLCVAMAGRRVVHDERAVAWDRHPDCPRDEFRRKVRTLSGNYQLFARLPAALLPWRNPLWVQLVSHKLCRLLVPWALIAALVLSARLPGWSYSAAFWGQVVAYAVAVAGMREPVGARFRPSAVGASFLLLNAAAWVAFWVWISGRASRSWTQARYAAGAAPRIA
jgi:hypothetical protein